MSEESECHECHSDLEAGDAHANDCKTPFFIDGMAHTRGDIKCCWYGGAVHAGCGGVVHHEAVYGPSFLYCCDRCDYSGGQVPNE